MIIVLPTYNINSHSHSIFQQETMFKTEYPSYEPEFSTSVKTENAELDCDKKEIVNQPTDFICPRCCTSFLDIEKFLNHVKEHDHDDLHLNSTVTESHSDPSTKLLPENEHCQNDVELRTHSQLVESKCNAEMCKEIHSKKGHMNVEYVSFGEVIDGRSELPLNLPPLTAPSPSETTTVQKRQRLNYCGTGRDFISVGDIDQGVAKVSKKRKIGERLKPGNVIEELGLVFSNHLAKLKAHRKIYKYLEKRRRRRKSLKNGIDVEKLSERFMGVDDGILNISAVTTRLDSGHRDLNDPENTPSADQAKTDKSISASSFADKITNKMVAFIDEIEESSDWRMNKHEFLNNIVKGVLPGYEIVKKKPSLNSFSLIKKPDEVAFD